MPRIVLKRDDIPEGFLQVLDLKPNTSQRSLSQTYQTVTQSKYVRPPQTGSVQLTGAGPITVVEEVSGLQAYLVANIPTTAQVAATASVTVASFGDVSVGDEIVIGGVTLIGVSGPRTPGSNDFSIDDDGGGGGTISDATTLVAELVRAINDAANGFGAIATAADNDPAVDLTSALAGDAGNATTLTTNDSTAFTVSGATFAGGTDATAMAAADADTIAQDILDNIVAFGDTAAAAVACDAAALDTEITNTVAGAPGVTAQQVEDILDILAGRTYRLPAGMQVEDAGNNLVPLAPTGETFGFVEGTLRNVYVTSSLRVSMTNGRLEKFLRTDFNYGEASGSNLEALVVYDDDGTIFVP